MKQELLAEIEDIERDCTGRLSFAFRDFQTNETLLYKASEPCKTASIIKLPLLVHIAFLVEEGVVSWEEKIILTETEKVGGAGVLTQMTAGLEISLRDVCVLMIIISDNTATNMLIERFGVKGCNERMRRFGLPLTTLFRKAYSPDTPESLEWGFGKTTAEEILTLLILLEEGKIGNARTRETILDILGGQKFHDGIPRFLPSGWRYFGKTGAIDAVRNDVGIVSAPNHNRYALSIFCQDLPIVLWTPENPGLLAIAKVAREALSTYLDN